jgi:hypothetical protein
MFGFTLFTDSKDLTGSTQLTARGDRTPILGLGMLREGPALNETELVDLMDKKTPLLRGVKTSCETFIKQRSN